MSTSDIHQTIDSALGTFVALMFMEALFKPVAARVGKWLLHKLDHKLPLIPDWLSGHNDDETQGVK